VAADSGKTSRYRAQPFSTRDNSLCAATPRWQGCTQFYVLITTGAGIFASIALAALLVSLLRLGLRLTSIKGDEEAMALGFGFTMAKLAAIMGNVYGGRFVDSDVMGIY
jgi:hypothetical protein